MKKTEKHKITLTHKLKSPSHLKYAQIQWLVLPWILKSFLLELKCCRIKNVHFGPISMKLHSLCPNFYNNMGVTL